MGKLFATIGTGKRLFARVYARVFLESTGNTSQCNGLLFLESCFWPYRLIYLQMMFELECLVAMLTFELAQVRIEIVTHEMTLQPVQIVELLSAYVTIQF